MRCWNKVHWLVKSIDMTCKSQSENFISAQCRYASLKFVYDIGSRHISQSDLCHFLFLSLFTSFLSLSKPRFSMFYIFTFLRNVNVTIS